MRKNLYRLVSSDAKLFNVAFNHWVIMSDQWW